ncbi:hypothetical protein [Pleionea sp. CnH1-48]|uniref:hypothetical protein n=1 Tax=Pleionea sp. CnH1-48 TaxID=2954494 RepID=UPI002096CE78|nr:hypothetical protein [Pleionea sp. CnH1-48]MCO7223219.1 hypothetical protein [Pleionea sp. CnH1-48]
MKQFKLLVVTIIAILTTGCAFHGEAYQVKLQHEQLANIKLYNVDLIDARPQSAHEARKLGGFKGDTIEQIEDERFSFDKVKYLKLKLESELKHKVGQVKLIKFQHIIDWTVTGSNNHQDIVAGAILANTGGHMYVRKSASDDNVSCQLELLVNGRRFTAYSKAYWSSKENQWFSLYERDDIKQRLAFVTDDVINKVIKDMNAQL